LKAIGKKCKQTLNHKQCPLPVLPTPGKRFRPDLLKNSAAHNYLLKRLLILPFKEIPGATEEGNFFRNCKEILSIFSRQQGYSCKPSKKFGPFSTLFLVNHTNIRPQSFQAADNFIPSLLNYAAEI
jgi:hypothetical protein